MAEPIGPFEQTRRDDALVVSASGPWVVDRAETLERALRDLGPSDTSVVRFDLGRLERLDMAGAFLLISTRERLEEAGTSVELCAVRDEHRVLLDHVERNAEAAETAALARSSRLSGLAGAIFDFGERVVGVTDELLDFIALLGMVLNRAWRLVLGRQRFEVKGVLGQMQQVWISAMPIVGVLSFLIGVVLMYQGVEQLRRVNQAGLAVGLVSLSIVREIGVLMAAVVVAGRSSSAFAAQIGAMKVRQEVNAMQVVGIDPVGALIVPRVLALFLTLPLLGFFSEIMALVGAGVMALFKPGMAPTLFISQLHGAVDLQTFWLGLIKAPVFAALIALVGCFQGLRVEGSAADVGRHTTRAVVQAIFLVIVAEALFSIALLVMGV